MLDFRISGRLYNLLHHDIFNSDVVAHFLLDYSVFAPISFVDIECENYFTYLSVNKYYKLYEENDELSDVFWKNYRQKIKFGRLISKLVYSNKQSFQYAIDTISDYHPEVKEISIDRHIQLFSSKLKGVFKSLTDKSCYSNIELLKGEEIRNAYLEENYSTGDGDLNRSCMRQKTRQHFLDLYVENSEICSLLVLKDQEGKIKTRALLWTLTNGSKFLDRIYTISDSDKFIFINYALANNWNFFDSDFEIDEILKIQVKHIYEYYPFMDTFSYVNFDDLTLQNKRKRGTYNATSQDGLISYIY